MLLARSHNKHAINAIDEHHLAQAYCFCGPRGFGENYPVHEY